MIRDEHQRLRAVVAEEMQRVDDEQARRRIDERRDPAAEGDRLFLERFVAVR
jgi:hypothetical protein